MELLIYITVLSFVVLMTSSSFISLMKGRGKSESASEINSTLRFALEKIIQDIKNASAVTIPVAVGGSGNILALTVSGNTITYDVSGGILRRQINATTPDLITASSTFVSNFFVARLENYNSVLVATTTSVRVSLTVNYNSGSPDWQNTVSATTTATLR